MTNPVYELNSLDDEIFYVHYPIKYDVWSVDQINKLPKDKLVIINMCSEHWGDNLFKEDLALQCQQANLNFLILTHDPLEHLIHPQIMYFPHWYYHSKKYFKFKEMLLSRKYKLSCLNANVRPHRIANYFLLLDKSYRDQINVSFYNIHDEDLPGRLDDIILNDSEVQRWNQTKNQLPIKPIDTLPDQDREIDIPALTDSYIHLVTETTVIPKIFLSEKTWKPIATGTLFLIFGNPGSVAHLRDLGVDVFDDIIDHDYYDHESDWRIRLSCIHTLIDTLVTKDFEHIYKITEKRRLENQQKFFAGEFSGTYNQELSTQIEKLKKCINMPN
jgi:hypothetical protein